MDNLCHTLAGAAIAHAGFARRLPRATVLGIVAANIPDVDAFTYFGGDAAFAVSFRRGWTHGLPALIAWSLVLAWVFARWARARPAPVTTAKGAPAVPDGDIAYRQYLALAAVAVCSHPVLDWLNTYGVRFLMPFSNHWFYGDTAFIVDPVLIVLFGAGWFISDRALGRGASWSAVPARVSLGVALAYVVAMKAMGMVTATAAAAQLGLAAPTAQQLMVAPRPINWLERDVIVRTDSSYDRYHAQWTGLRAGISEQRWSDPTGADSALVEAIRATVDGERFLRWSRLPYFVRDPGGETAFVGDLRYSSGTTESWAGIRVRLPAPPFAGR